MAESAEHAMELKIEEFEEMQRIGVLSESELSELKEKLRDFEYKLRGVIRDVNSYRSYIIYLEGLLKLVRARRKKIKINEKKGSIEHRIIAHIKKIYENARQFAPDNYDLALDFFSFCKREHRIDSASVVINKLLMMYPGKEQLWNLAASWYADGEKNSKKALETLLRGLQLHPDSQLMYKHAIELQLKEARVVIGKCEKNSPNLVDNKRNMYVEKVNSIIDVAFKNIRSYLFYFDVLNLFDSYEFHGDVEKRILDKIVTDYAQEPQVWYHLAERRLRGTEGDIQFCISTYLEGLNKIPHENKPQLWSLFLKFLTQSYKRKDVTVNVLNEYLLKADRDKCLPEEYYDHWLTLNKNEFGVEVLQKAIAAYPQSAKWYELYLKYKILKHASTAEITTIFRKGDEALGEKAINLWKLFMQYLIVQSLDNEVQRYFIEGTKKSGEISLVLRPQYLEWLRLTKSVEEVRRAYQAMCDMRPYCKSVHMIMLDMESVERDLDRMETIYKTLSEQFPHDLDVWVGFMEYYVYTRTKDKKEKNATDRSTVYNRALHFLSGPAQTQFKEKCSHHLLSTI